MQTASGLSPLEMLTKTTDTYHTDLQRCRMFGCPVYVFDARIKDGGKTPKWQKRSQRGIFVGYSTGHSFTVALVLNPDTGHMRAQYHVVFDELFNTTTAKEPSQVTLDTWNDLLTHGYDQHWALDSEDDNGNPVNDQTGPSKCAGFQRRFSGK